MRKTYNEKHHACLNRVYFWRGTFYYSQAILQVFDFTDVQKRYDLKEVMQLNSEVLNMANGELLDLGVPKPKAEFLAAGHCYPAEKIARKSFARITLGQQQKTLVVYGNRYWEGAGIASVKTEPEEFSKMPLSNQQAFGGEGYLGNPQGKGIGYVEPPKKDSGLPILPKMQVDFKEFPDDDKKETDQSAPKMFSYPLPNTENPNDLILKKNDMPAPATFYPITYSNQERTKLFGTFDEKWLKKSWPHFADDMKWEFFMCSAKDQQFEEYFRGDEHFSIENMHPEKSHITGQLPLWNVRCFVEKEDANKHLHYSEVEMKLDTVWFLPDTLQGVLVWHGYTPVKDQEASDLKTIQVVDEDLMSERKDKNYYYDLLKKKKHRPNLQERQKALKKELEPHNKKAQEAAWQSFEKKYQECLKHLQNVQKRFTKQMSKLKEDHKNVGKVANASIMTHLPFNPLKHKGKDIATLKKEIEDMKSKHGLDFFKKGTSFKDGIARMRKYTDDKVKATLEPLKKELAKHHLDIDKLIKHARQENSQAEAKSMEQHIKKTIRETSQPKLKHSLSNLLATYQSTIVPSIHDKLQKSAGLILKTREQVEAALKNKQPFGKCYIQCLDLSNLDFSNQDLKKARFLYCELQNADFSGSDLSAGLLMGCDLTSANFSKATLLSVNLGQTVLNNADFSDADCEHANFMESTAMNTNFSRANLDGSKMLAVKWQHINFQASRGNKAVIQDANMTHINFRDAVFKSGVFSGGEWNHVDLSGGNFSKTMFSKLSFTQFPAENSTLTSCFFNECKLLMANFTKANCEKAKFASCEIKDALFIETTMPQANFTALKGEQVKFIDCDMKNSRFLQESTINHCWMERCNADTASWLDATLTHAIFKRCSLQHLCAMGASFRGAQFLYCDLTGSNLNKTDLQQSKFYWSNLTSAGLREANIMFTVFKNCNLYNLDFYHAVTRDTVMDKNLMKDPLPDNFEEMFIHG